MLVKCVLQLLFPASAIYYFLNSYMFKHRLTIMVRCLLLSLVLARKWQGGVNTQPSFKYFGNDAGKLSGFFFRTLLLQIMSVTHCTDRGLENANAIYKCQSGTYWFALAYQYEPTFYLGANLDAMSYIALIASSRFKVRNKCDCEN